MSLRINGWNSSQIEFFQVKVKMYNFEVKMYSFLKMKIPTSNHIPGDSQNILSLQSGFLDLGFCTSSIHKYVYYLWQYLYFGSFVCFILALSHSQLRLTLRIQEPFVGWTKSLGFRFDLENDPTSWLNARISSISIHSLNSKIVTSLCDFVKQAEITIHKLA